VFTSVAGVPVLRLSFLVTENFREGRIQDEEDEVLDIGKFELEL